MIPIATLAGEGDRQLARIAAEGHKTAVDAVAPLSAGALKDALLALLHDPAPAARPPAVGTTCGDFKIAEVLSGAGQPWCLRAADPFHRGIEPLEVVLKEIRGSSPAARARCLLTQSQVTQAASDAAAAILGFHLEGSRALVVRRFVPGVTLARILHTLLVEEVPPDSPTWRLAAGARGGGANVTGAKIVCRIGQFTAQALMEVNAKGAIHGALKPENLICDDTVKPTVVDFGIGTPCVDYLAPELIRAGDREAARTPASDLYALGAILHQALTRRKVFGDGSAAEIEQRHLEQKPDQPTKHNFKASKEMSIIALALLEKEPGKRYASAAELYADLDRYHKNEPIRRKAPGMLSRLFG